MTGRKIKKKCKTLKNRDYLSEFIRYYKLLPALWNTKCLDYHNRDVKAKSYMLLLKKYRESEPTATLRDVKAKLNALRSNYRRYLRKADTNAPEREMPWMNEMSFINGDEDVDSEIDVEASYLELKNEPAFDEEAELTGDIQHLQQLDVSESTINNSEWENESTPTQVYVKVKKEKPKLIYKDDDMSSNGHFEDEYDFWGRLMATELRKMSQTQQIYAKRAITDTLMEGQLGLLHKDSVQINKTPDITGCTTADAMISVQRLATDQCSSKAGD